MPLTGVLADRMATYIVGFSDNCARNAPPEIVFMSRDDSPVRVRVWLPQRYDVMRPVVAVLYKNRPRRILLPAAVRVVDNGTDDKGIKPDCFALLSLIDDEYTASQPIRSNCYNLKKIKKYDTIYCNNVAILRQISTEFNRRKRQFSPSFIFLRRFRFTRHLAKHSLSVSYSIQLYESEIGFPKP